jgi:hypothetical protein
MAFLLKRRDDLDIAKKITVLSLSKRDVWSAYQHIILIHVACGLLTHVV